jgi:hypothetical protein
VCTGQGSQFFSFFGLVIYRSCCRISIGLNRCLFCLCRDALKPKTAQLTIFYAGSVNVFDNVSAEKV